MKRLRAFGSYIKLTWVSAMLDYGYYDSDKQHISINANHTLLTQQRTLGHELTHLIEDHYGFELPEEIIDKIGIGWVTLLQENKQLVEFITKEDK